MKGEGVPFHAQRAEHGAEGQIQVEQNRPLFNVQFQIGRRLFQFRTAVLDPFKIHARGAQRLGQGNAVAVAEAAGFVEIKVAGTGGGAKQAFAKARAFFIRPGHQPHGDRGAAGVLLMDTAQDFHAGQDVQAAIEPTAVGHGIKVAAEEQGAFGFAGEGDPEVAGGVSVDFHGQAGELLPEPLVGGDPQRSEGHALCALGIACQRAQFLQFGNGPLRVHRSLAVGHGSLFPID